VRETTSLATRAVAVAIGADVTRRHPGRGLVALARLASDIQKSTTLSIARTRAYVSNGAGTYVASEKGAPQSNETEPVRAPKSPTIINGGSTFLSRSSPDHYRF
jgi:hypothetical protein